jgi:phage-related protein
MGIVCMSDWTYVSFRFHILGQCRGVGKRCHELRITDEAASWRVMYRLEPDAVVILAVFRKTTSATPRQIIAQCQQRLQLYEDAKEI